MTLRGCIALVKRSYSSMSKPGELCQTGLAYFLGRIYGVNPEFNPKPHRTVSFLCHFQV